MSRRGRLANDERLGKGAVRFTLRDQGSDLALAGREPTVFLLGRPPRGPHGRIGNLCECMPRKIVAQRIARYILAQDRDEPTRFGKLALGVVAFLLRQT